MDLWYDCISKTKSCRPHSELEDLKVSRVPYDNGQVSNEVYIEPESNTSITTDYLCRFLPLIEPVSTRIKKYKSVNTLQI